MTSIDWNSLAKVAEEATKLVPDGTYGAECLKCEPATASTGKPMLKLTLKISDGPSAGRNLWTQFVVAEDSGFALQRLFGNLAAFGITQDFLDQGPSFEMVASALVGRHARVIVGHRSWQGQDRNEVTGILAAEDAIQPALPDLSEVLVDVGKQYSDGTKSGQIAF